MIKQWHECEMSDEKESMWEASPEAQRFQNSKSLEVGKKH